MPVAPYEFRVGATSPGRTWLRAGMEGVRAPQCCSTGRAGCHADATDGVPVALPPAEGASEPQSLRVRVDGLRCVHCVHRGAGAAASLEAVPVAWLRRQRFLRLRVYSE